MAETRTKKINGKPRTSTAPSEDTLSRKINTVKGAIDKLDNPSKIRVFKEIGIGKEYFTCYRCGEVKRKVDFYASTEADCQPGISRICKKCASDIVNVDNGSGQFAPTKNSVIDVLCALNKPFLNAVWDSALLDAANTVGAKRYSSVWNAYISMINLPTYQTLTYADSDMFTGGKYTFDALTADALPKDQEIIDQYEKNKADVKRLLGYEPFEKERLADQPFLYSQLIGFLDTSEDANDDMMKVSSAISIVRGFLQQAQIDDKITMIMQDVDNLDRKIPQLKQLQDMKSKVSSVISDLAEQSCISQKHNKNAKKGENTWTGKIRKLKEMNLREQEVNAFDIGTCAGMQQVADISHASIIKQIKLDENDYTEMLASQRDMIVNLQKQLDEYMEKARILLRENLDLKAYMEEKNILLKDCLTSETILYEEDDIEDGDSDVHS